MLLLTKKYKKRILIAFVLALLLVLYAVLYKIYIPRANAFGCFDDCNNFMRGYFFLNGNPLFSSVFSGHQPFGSYLSALIQWIAQPVNMSELILKHRQFVLVFSLVSNAILILRFGPKMILFTVIFEFSKFYIFGDRFLGEAMIVYPSIYMAGVVTKKFLKEKIYKFDYYLAAIFCWLIVFTRAPFAPMALLSFSYLLWEWPLAKIKKVKIYSIVLFAVVCLLTILAHDVKEYFYNVIVFNFQVNLAAESKLEMAGPRIFHWFFYPVYIFLYGPQNIFKYLLISINIVFVGVFLSLLVQKKYKLALFIFLILGLSNIRPVIPGALFYGSFHMIIWYGLFVFTTLFLLFKKVLNIKLSFLGFLVLTLSFAFFIISPEYFAKENIDTHKEFVTNYGYVLQRGEVIKALSNPTDTLFLDASDDMIYWQSQRFSPYEYSWYTSAMPLFEKYTKARIEMFESNPPDFYKEYGSCPKNKEPNENYSLPEFVKDDYVRLYTDGRESCLFVHKEKIKEITEEQWKRAAEHGFYPPGK